jgi:hypothetical protein
MSITTSCCRFIVDSTSFETFSMTLLRGGDDAVRVTYVRDIPESVLKPAPVQALAALGNPALRVFTPVPPESELVASAVAART